MSSQHISAKDHEQNCIQICDIETGVVYQLHYRSEPELVAILNESQLLGDALVNHLLEVGVVWPVTLH